MTRISFTNIRLLLPTLSRGLKEVFQWISTWGCRLLIHLTETFVKPFSKCCWNVKNTRSTARVCHGQCRLHNSSAGKTSSSVLLHQIHSRCTLICSKRGKVLKQTPDMAPPPLPLYANIGTKMSHYLKLSLNSLCGDWARGERGGFYLPSVGQQQW